MHRSQLRRRRIIQSSLLVLHLLSAILLGAQQRFGDNPRDLVALPAYEETDPVFFYTAFALQYNEEHEQADWVAWRLTDERVNSRNAERSDRFRSDPAIATGSATLQDYRGSGFDRGHLAPAADFRFSAQAMLESFLFSNMSPQRPVFNRGIWASLEAIVRGWADRYGEVFIVTGPVLDRTDLERIGPNRVSVPEYFYKAVLYWNEDEARCIGFILPNQRGEVPLASYACSIDDLEARTGLDFFPALPDDLENEIEAGFDLSWWPLIEFRQQRVSP